MFYTKVYYDQLLSFSLLPHDVRLIKYDVELGMLYSTPIYDLVWEAWRDL